MLREYETHCTDINSRESKFKCFYPSSPKNKFYDELCKCNRTICSHKKHFKVYPRKSEYSANKILPVRGVRGAVQKRGLTFFADMFFFMYTKKQDRNLNFYFPSNKTNIFLADKGFAHPPPLNGHVR